MIKVLLVEDDLDLGNLLKQYLEAKKFLVQRVFNGVEAREDLKKNQYDILILDIMMPREDGFELAENLNKQYPELPFLFVTARKMKEDVLRGLKLGAEDYITKPFDADELILRIQNVLKRNNPDVAPKMEVFNIGKFVFDSKNLRLTFGDSIKTLTEKEAQLLLYLVQNKDQLIRRENILNMLWKENDFFSGRSLDVFISRLRKYLSKDDSIVIESVRGIGFRFIIQ